MFKELEEIERKRKFEEYKNRRKENTQRELRKRVADKAKHGKIKILLIPFPSDEELPF